MTSKLVVNTIESDTGISSVSFASSISMNSTAKFHFSAAGIDIGADTNINRPSAGVLGFNINSSEKARIDSSGRLSIGGENAGHFYSGADNLVVADFSADTGISIFGGSSNKSFIAMGSTTFGTGALEAFIEKTHGNNNPLTIATQIGNSNIEFKSANDFVFSSYSGPTERVRIDSSGNVNITGITTISGALHVGDNLAFTDNNQQIQTGSSGYMLGIQGGATNMGGRIEFRGGNSTGDIRMFAQGATSTQVERLRIKSDGVISFDGGTTAAVTPSQTTASSIGHQTMSGGTNWFNHAGGLDYFGVDGDWKLTNGATYGKIVARNASASISNAEQAGHTWFLVCKTVAGTLGNGNWVVEPVAGWKMAWPTSLAAGAVATFYMRDAVESFGSPTIPASGDYYIGWFYSTSQQRGTNGGSYYTDSNAGGKIYYYSGEGDMSNPHQRIPRQGDSWDNTMSGEKIHFRFETLPKADLTGTVFASPLLVDPVMEGVPLIDGFPMAGGQLVKDVQWATNVSSVEFMNADFVNCNYLVTYSINGADANNNATGWHQTRLQFCDHDGAFFTGTNDYISHCEWCNSTSTSATINSTYAGYQRSIWLTGNGSDYDHEGYVWIIPSNFRHNRNATISQRWGNGTEYTSLTHPRIFVRGHSHLSAGTDSTHYREEGGGTYRGTNDLFRISGFRLYGSNSSDYHTPASNGSSNGYVRIWRFKSGFEAREVS